MANLQLALFIFIFGCIFMNEKVKAFDKILSLPNHFLNVIGPITSSAKLPVTNPPPPVSTTSCSTYPHADKGIENFQRLCYTQLYVQPYAYYPYKCRTMQFTVGLPVANVPFPIPKVVGFTPQAGYAFSDAVSITNASQHFTYNYTFVETQTAEISSVIMNPANLTVINSGVITSYTDKGYVFLVCAQTNLTTPLCSFVSLVSVCTYQRNPPKADLQALTQGLDQYPYYFGKNLLVMNQTGCT